MQICLETQRGVTTPTVRRISPQIFWALLVIEGAVFTLLLAWVLASLAPQTPIATTNTEITVLRSAISDRLTGAVNDPLVELPSGKSIRESNIRGLSSNGVTYYYYVEGQTNFDPFSQGLVPATRVEKIFRDDSGPAPIVIYTIHG